jgi:succinate dehydrogenase hydrophobic anchor subunit
MGVTSMPLSHDRSRLAWLAQAVSGGMLLALLMLHMLANHFVVEGGIRTYADVICYLGNPIVLPLELLFLVIVTVHALLGVRAVILDFGISEKAQRGWNRLLVVLGASMIAYGFWLTGWILTRGS